MASSFDDLPDATDPDLDDFFGENDMQEAFPHPGDDFTIPADAEGELSSLMKEAGADAEFNINGLNDRELELGEKADDAIDYGDLSSDDDLPEEETAHGGRGQQNVQFLSGIEDIAMDGVDDDLFGDGPSSPVGPQATQGDYARNHETGVDADSDLASEHGDVVTTANSMVRPEPDLSEDPQWRIQLSLFAQSGKGIAPLTQEENNEEWLKMLFPKYNPAEMPYFNRLFPPKNLHYIGKVPLKLPKPVRPVKVNIELDQDQKVLFNSSTVSSKRSWENENAVVVAEGTPGVIKSDEESEEESDLDEELPGGVSMQDLEFICADFDTLSQIAESDAEIEDLANEIAHDHVDMFAFDSFPNFDRPAKRRRLGLEPSDIVSMYHYDMPSFDHPEKLTQKISSKIVLDLNDPQLLIEEVDPETVRTKVQTGDMGKGSKSVNDLLQERFNHSNDAEYDLLKQNHQHKIRSTLGNLSIDHSVPALRLQYPYYKVKLSTSEARKFHRPTMTFKPLATVSFTKPNKIKRKHIKGKKIKEIYAMTKDLSFGDNSTALLLEYAEEHPMMMSQIGMGTRVMNYYRRQTKDDVSRPKGDIGETAVLLPEDKSPFHIFGHIEAGETVTALYNSMYRAPIFEQQSRSQDFVVVRSSTGLQGPHYFLRNIDHLYVVGQEFPSVTVPGPHSRVVTTASKNRLKAISYRIIRRKKNQRLRVEDVTRHFPDTTDMQNRQKMKEFMSFSKEHKEWEMKPGDVIPDEDVIQTLIRPEDVCLLESMQVGQQYLQDAGYGQEDDDDDDDGKDGEGQTLEQELAPWKTSKNFINATQGKAMLRLHGDGDPSGRGEAFSFIKTSMKGGFKAIGESAMDKITEKKELGGHSYNVARQQRSYEDSIRRIWDLQKASLSSTIEHSDVEMDDGVDGAEQISAINGKTPRSEAPTPVPFRRRDDESQTSFSKRSVGSSSAKYLKIVRTVRRGGQDVAEEALVEDQAVIKQYLKRRHQKEAASTALVDIVPTGDEERDARNRKRIEEELARLERNRERRFAREKAKGNLNPGPPGSAMSPGSPETPVVSSKQQQGTQRKCANCGQVGHIKTNKKLCPLLNGTVKQEDGFNNAAFMGAPPTMS